jgi:hypothetical protein
VRLASRCCRDRGPSPMFGRWSYEMKWDGFRAIVRTVEGLRVHSRRGRNMTALLRALDELPAGVVSGYVYGFLPDRLAYAHVSCVACGAISSQGDEVGSSSRGAEIAVDQADCHG